MKGFMLILASLFAAVTVTAQEVTLSVDAPGSAVAGQGFRIVYSVNSTDGQFIPPKFDPSFQVSGPQQSTSRNVQWINGKVNSVSSTTLMYYVVASTPGKYTIPPAQFETKKLTVSSAPVEIEITDVGASGSRQQAPPEKGQATAAGSELSLRLLLSTRDVYVGQPVAATLKLYTRINLSGINDLKYPDFKGFLRDDIDTPPLKSLEPETIDGVEYGTGVIQNMVLYPQISGDIRVEPVEMTALVQQKTGGGDPFFNDPFFDNFFSNVTTMPRTVKTQPVVIRVKPLPIPQPADFHGAVGSFELSSSLSKSEVEVNDAVTLTVTLKGSGNLSLAGEPVINFPQGIEKYDPKVTIKRSSSTSGTKTFEYLLIPRNTGRFDIPPVSYTVFDPGREKYVTLRAEGYTIKVSGTAGATEAATPAYTPGEEVKYLGQDIRFIRNGRGGLRPVSPSLVAASYFWLWYALALFMALVVLLLRREHIRRNADVTGVRNRKAARNARKRLSRARSLLGADKPGEVNAEIAKALWGYLGDKLAITQSDLTKEKCYSSLRVRNVVEPLITEIDSILTATEYSQYAPASDKESPEGLYKRASALIDKLDNVLS